MILGFLGLGKMGTRIVRKLLQNGHTIIAWNRTAHNADEFYQSMVEQNLANNLTIVRKVSDVITHLKSHRIIWSMLPAGDATELVMQVLLRKSSPNDIIIDGANSHFKDTQRRYEMFTAKKIRFLGIGVSGGIRAAAKGYPFMVGGDKSAYKKISPLLSELSKPHGSHTYFGTGGAGHFVKMVHNGIEYGMMQAIGEGIGILDKSPYTLDLLAVVTNWQKSTIISSFLIDCAKEALQKDRKLRALNGVIQATGEGEWTVKQAKAENVPVENIEQALSFRTRSRTDKMIQESFAARLIAAIRREFGGHTIVSSGLDEKSS